MFDWKVTDPTKHKALTGQTNDLILSNLEYLSRAGANIILRCPLIPGINDDQSHLEGIATLSKRHEIAVEIMPYHPLGMGKLKNLSSCEKISKNNLPVSFPSDETKQNWVEALKKLGCNMYM